MKHTNKWEDVISMKPLGFPTFSIVSTKGVDPVEIVEDMIENYNINNNGEIINITLNCFKRIVSSVENDTFKIITTQVFIGRNPETENVILTREYFDMVLVYYDTYGGYNKQTTFTYYFKRADMVDKDTDN